jgi:phage terminase large subunit GpA-like protein
MILTAGVDVQHDRLAIVIRAWGRGMESWLVYWGEIHGQTLIPNAGAWADLDLLLESDFVHASGNVLRIRAASIDSSDGTTTDAVYAYVRGRKSRGYMAIKGASEQSADTKEIFSKPKTSVDWSRKHKPHPSGVTPYIVGTHRAKDLIIDGRLRLTGSGPGRLHWYKTVRPDYWDQITSEIKVPHKTQKSRKVWAKRASTRNEALDCEVYALHSAMSLKLHLLKPSHWDGIEEQLRQKQIFAEASAPAAADPDLMDVDDELGADDPAAAGESVDAAAEPVQTSAQPQQPAPLQAVVTPLRKSKRVRSRTGGYSATNF